MMRRTSWIGILALLAAASASAETGKDRAAFYRNAKVLTVDLAFRTAKAMAVRGDRILTVGSEAESARRALSLSIDTGSHEPVRNTELGMSDPVIKIGFYHDVVCGWCFVIAPRLRKLSEELPLEIRHRSFVLQDSREEMVRLGIAGAGQAGDPRPLGALP